MNRKTPGEAVVRTSSLGGVPGPSRSHAHRHHQSSLALLLSHSGTDPCLQRQNGEKWLPTTASGTSGQMKSREEPLNRGEKFQRGVGPAVQGSPTKASWRLASLYRLHHLKANPFPPEIITQWLKWPPDGPEQLSVTLLNMQHRLLEVMSPPWVPSIPETYTLGMMSTVISEFWIFCQGRVCSQVPRLIFLKLNKKGWGREKGNQAGPY